MTIIGLGNWEVLETEGLRNRDFTVHCFRLCCINVMILCPLILRSVSSLCCCFIVFSDESMSEATTATAADVEDNAILKHGDQFADYLKKGLSDNWSQVRLHTAKL